MIHSPLATSPGLTAPLRASPASRSAALETLVRNAVMGAIEHDDVQGLLRLLKIDPLAQARFLRVVNSPLFGRGQAVGCAAEALGLLGIRAAAFIALVSSFDYGFSRRRHGSRLETIRAHSLRTAVLSRHIAGLAGLAAQAEHLFAAGLLHDVAAMLRPIAPQEGRAGHHCSAASAQLMSAWRLPDVIVHAIAGAGDPMDRKSGPIEGPRELLSIAHHFEHLLCPGHVPEIAELFALGQALNADLREVVVAVHEARDDLGRCLVSRT